MNNQERKNLLFRPSTLMRTGSALPKGSGLGQGSGIFGYRRKHTVSDTIIDEEGGEVEEEEGSDWSESDTEREDEDDNNNERTRRSLEVSASDLKDGETPKVKSRKMRSDVKETSPLEKFDKKKIK